MGIYLGTAAALLVYLVLSWLLGSWLKLSGSDLWILRAGLALLGVIAAASFLWFYKRAHRPTEDDVDIDDAASTSRDIDLLMNEATRRLQSSNSAKGATLRTSPLIFLVGETGSIKTSTIVNSGLDPELLAGRAYQENQILPTRVANFWYTREAIFVDCAGEMLEQPGLWTHLIRVTQPGRVSSTVGSFEQAPRAVVLCYSIENFLFQGAAEASVAAARKFNARLQELSRQLSISFPLYVLFTKLDRVPFFTEYAQNLNGDEANDVLGATLPVKTAGYGGVYAEEEGRRLTKAFDEIFYSLAERRMELLGREHRSDKQPAIYEFPRELRKLRTPVTDFLVNIARPSQLQVNPFLRGFYFSGVRPVIIENIAKAVASSAVRDSAPADAAATRIFSASTLRQPEFVASSASTRKVPQWTFVTKLFHEVILKDRVALSTSRHSARSNVARRVLFGSLIFAALMICAAFVVSYFQNRSLEADVIAAARDIQPVQLQDKQLAEVADLQRLERLRTALARLTQYRKEGVPLRLRWGLYVGDDIYPDARKIYFLRFRQLLLAQTQNHLLDWMRALPPTPGPNDSYEKSYNALKAYLITTSFNDKSTATFLSPVLQNFWVNGRDVDQQRSDLARRQFDFYSTELTASNPYSDMPTDAAMVAKARDYLVHFGAIERFYLPLVSEASLKNRSMSFNDEFRDSAGVVNSSTKISGAFTAAGFRFMEDAIRQPQRYIQAEQWVLGQQSASELDAATLQQKLKQRYYQEFLDQWRALLSHAHVAPFGKEGADDKLGKLSSQTSPMLELLWFISHNTGNSAPEIAEPFQTVQAIVPPGAPENSLPDQYVMPSNQAYVQALGKLRSDLSLYVRDGNSTPALAQQALASAEAAKQSIGQVMGPKIDNRFHTEAVVRQLLEEPIRYAEAIVSRGPAEALNAGGKNFCSKFEELKRYYPFDPGSSNDLPLAKLNEIFAPSTGALWTFYNDPSTKLTQYLTRNGQPLTSGAVKISPAFANFFRQASAISTALYGDTSADPRFAFRLGTLKTDVSGLTIKIADQTLNEGDPFKSFTWTGKEDVQVTARGVPFGAYSGPWAVFRFVSGAQWTEASPGVAELRRDLQSNGQLLRLPDGRVMFFDYQLQTSGVNPLRPGLWSGMRCVSQVAR